MTKCITFILLKLISLQLIFCQQNLTTGPENGHLIIAGGALRDTSVFNKFIELAGSNTSHIIVIPTAGGNEITPNRIEGLKKDWENKGAAKVTILHTTDPDEANSPEFANVINEATGVWFLGGRQWRLADSYLNTLTHKNLDALLERGGVIGGSSAGATIQGSYLARGDSKTNTIMVGDHEEGLGFVKNIAIDRHTLARNRQFDMFEILNEYPDLLGLALDENTAIWVQGNQFEVIGDTYVVVYDGTYWNQHTNEYEPTPEGRQRFHLLSAGQKYDLEQRRVLKDR